VEVTIPAVNSSNPSTQSTKLAKLPQTACVIRVGEGRGFIVEHRFWTKLPELDNPQNLRNRLLRQRLVVTAAHCLPKLPPAHAFSYTQDRTYANLLGLLRGQSTVWAECLFVDPVMDIAVLGEPDSQDLYQECDAFWHLIEEAPIVPMGSKIGDNGWVLSLDGE